MKWRKPGQPYQIEVAGVKLTCKAMTRAEALALTEQSTTMPNEEGGVERFYQMLVSQILTIEGFSETPDVVLDSQGHDVMLAIFKEIIGASALTPVESKNLPPSSDGPEPARPMKDAPTSEDQTAAGEPPVTA